MKFVKGEIYVRTGLGDGMGSSFNEVGDMTKAERDDKWKCVYQKGYSTSKVREATEKEIYWFNRGIKNIKDIPKEIGLNYEIC